MDALPRTLLQILCPQGLDGQSAVCRLKYACTKQARGYGCNICTEIPRGEGWRKVSHFPQICFFAGGLRTTCIVQIVRKMPWFAVGGACAGCFLVSSGRQSVRGSSGKNQVFSRVLDCYGHLGRFGRGGSIKDGKLIIWGIYQYESKGGARVVRVVREGCETVACQAGVLRMRGADASGVLTDGKGCGLHCNASFVLETILPSCNRRRGD